LETIWCHGFQWGYVPEKTGKENVSTAIAFLSVHGQDRGGCPFFQLGTHGLGASDSTALTTTGVGNILVAIISDGFIIK
jgi:hypothetical protein